MEGAGIDLHTYMIINALPALVSKVHCFLKIYYLHKDIHHKQVVIILYLYKYTLHNEI